jgi:hypothetical protein
MKYYLIFSMMSLTLGSLAASPQAYAQPATAHAASGAPAVLVPGHWQGLPTAAKTATITWTVPTFTADGTALPTTPVPLTESKFNLDPDEALLVLALSKRDFEGYSISGTGPLGSTITSKGEGKSNITAIAAGFLYSADFTVTAGGTLASGGSYDVKAVAKDPWNITASDLSTISGSTYDLYIPFSMLGGQSDATGSFGFDVTYTTASGTTTLLDAAFHGTDAVITTATGFGTSLKFYQQVDATAFPNGLTLPGTLLSVADLQSLVSSNLDTNGNLAPTHLGIVLSDIPIPTLLLSDGSVAQIGANAHAAQAQSSSPRVPEPATLLFMGLGVIGLVLRRR